MLRTATAAAAAVFTISLINAPAATAQPKLCESHGINHVYIAACAGGGGGGGYDPPVPRSSPLGRELAQKIADKIKHLCD